MIKDTRYQGLRKLKAKDNWRKKRKKNIGKKESRFTLFSLF